MSTQTHQQSTILCRPSVISQQEAHKERRRRRLAVESGDIREHLVDSGAPSEVREESGIEHSEGGENPSDACQNESAHLILEHVEGALIAAPVLSNESPHEDEGIADIPCLAHESKSKKFSPSDTESEYEQASYVEEDRDQYWCGSGEATDQSWPGEESPRVYRRNGFHPVRLNELYNSRYKVVRKLGCGACSTVWLVEDVVQGHYRAMKVSCAWAYRKDSEREVHELLRYTKPNHRGYGSISHLLDSFMHAGPNGVHQCLIFELMGESLRTYPRKFSEEGGNIPEAKLKDIARQLLDALSYAHECGIVHTDLKKDNIFVKMVVDQSIIDRKFLPESELAMDDQGSRGIYSVIRSMPLNQFYWDTREQAQDARTCLGDWGLAHFKRNIRPQIIQTGRYRAPEVRLGAQWDDRADLWNLGLLLLDLFDQQNPIQYCKEAEESGQESESVQSFMLRQIQYAFGEGCFPRSLLKRGDSKLVQTHFGEDNRVKPLSQEKEQEAAKRLGEGLKTLRYDDFYSWLHFLMQVEPRDRPSITELLQHPWLA